MVAWHYMTAVQIGRSSNLTSYAAVFYWFLNTEKYVPINLLHLTANVVEIIAETHANWFSDYQIVYMEKRKKKRTSGRIFALNSQIQFNWKNSDSGTVYPPLYSVNRPLQSPPHDRPQPAERTLTKQPSLILASYQFTHRININQLTAAAICHFNQWKWWLAAAKNEKLLPECFVHSPLLIRWREKRGV